MSSGGEEPPASLVTLIVGETGRQSRARAAAGRAAASLRPDASGRPPATGGAAAPQSAWQWSTRWGQNGPGPVSSGCEGEPDLTLALSPDDARSVCAGRLAPSVAYMQGRLKTSGDNGLLLQVLRWSATPGFGAALAKWLEQHGAPALQGL